MLSSLCLPVGLSLIEIEKLDKLIQQRETLSENEFLFREGELFKGIYAVRSGTVKTYSYSAGGKERIQGFYFAGELLGFHAIHAKRYLESAQAIERTSICRIPFDKLSQFAIQLPLLQKQLYELMSQQLSVAPKIDPGAGAQERLALFLLGISTRLQRRGLQGAFIELTMTREDIASHLGLAAESVSRLFSRFKKQGIIDFKGRQVLLTDLRALQKLCCLSHQDGML